MNRPCPLCGGPLANPRAKRCRNCWLARSKQRADPPGTPCIDCGGPKKTRYSTRCKTCANRIQAVKAEEDRKQYRCLDCGGRISPKAKRCRPCQVKRFQEHPPNPKGFPGGPLHPSWRGGRFVGNKGYVYIWVGYERPGNRRGYLLEHRAIMEDILGRALTSKEVVHHRNGIRHDNRPENLELAADHGAHLREHHRYTGVRGGGTLINCPNCQCEIDLTKLAGAEES